MGIEDYYAPNKRINFMTVLWMLEHDVLSLDVQAESPRLVANEKALSFLPVLEANLDEVALAVGDYLGYLCDAEGGLGPDQTASLATLLGLPADDQPGLAMVPMLVEDGLLQVREPSDGVYEMTCVTSALGEVPEIERALNSFIARSREYGGCAEEFTLRVDGLAGVSAEGPAEGATAELEALAMEEGEDRPVWTEGPVGRADGDDGFSQSDELVEDTAEDCSEYVIAGREFSVTVPGISGLLASYEEDLLAGVNRRPHCFVVTEAAYLLQRCALWEYALLEGYTSVFVKEWHGVGDNWALASVLGRDADAETGRRWRSVVAPLRMDCADALMAWGPSVKEGRSGYIAISEAIAGSVIIANPDGPSDAEQILALSKKGTILPNRIERLGDAVEEDLWFLRKALRGLETQVQSQGIVGERDLACYRSCLDEGWAALNDIRLECAELFRHIAINQSKFYGAESISLRKMRGIAGRLEALELERSAPAETKEAVVGISVAGHFDENVRKDDQHEYPLVSLAQGQAQLPGLGSDQRALPIFGLSDKWGYAEDANGPCETRPEPVLNGEETAHATNEVELEPVLLESEPVDTGEKIECAENLEELTGPGMVERAEGFDAPAKLDEAETLEGMAEDSVVPAATGVPVPMLGPNALKVLREIERSAGSLGWYNLQDRTGLAGREVDACVAQLKMLGLIVEAHEAHPASDARGPRRCFYGLSRLNDAGSPCFDFKLYRYELQSALESMGNEAAGRFEAALIDRGVQLNAEGEVRRLLTLSQVSALAACDSSADLEACRARLARLIANEVAVTLSPYNTWSDYYDHVLCSIACSESLTSADDAAEPRTDVE